MRTPTDETALPHTRPRSFIVYALERSTLQLAVKVALVVGTILGIINHGQAILTGHFTTDRLISLLLTYLVPFSVSTYSQVRAKMQRDGGGAMNCAP